MPIASPDIYLHIIIIFPTLFDDTHTMLHARRDFDITMPDAFCFRAARRGELSYMLQRYVLIPDIAIGDARTLRRAYDAAIECLEA